MNETRSTRSFAARLAWLALFALFAHEAACDGPSSPPPKNYAGLSCQADTDCAPPATVCCNKECAPTNGVSTSTATAVCGSCDSTCSSSETCCQSDGVYSCTPASVFNCGTCGNICSTTEECVNGHCVPPTGDDGGGSSSGGGGDASSCSGNVCDSGGACAKLGSQQLCTMNVTGNPAGGCCSGLVCGYGYPSGSTSLALSVCCVKPSGTGCTQSSDCCAVDSNTLPTCNSGTCCVASGAGCDSTSTGAPCCSGVCAVNASNLYVCQ